MLFNEKKRFILYDPSLMWQERNSAEASIWFGFVNVSFQLQIILKSCCIPFSHCYSRTFCNHLPGGYHTVQHCLTPTRTCGYLSYPSVSRRLQSVSRSSSTVWLLSCHYSSEALSQIHCKTCFISSLYMRFVLMVVEMMRGGNPGLLFVPQKDSG